MTGIEFLFAFGKAFFVVMFAMNVAVILTWADRRYGALLQDRVGPERAVVWLPRRVAQGLAFLPALAVAVGVVLFAWANKEDAQGLPGNAVLLVHGELIQISQRVLDALDRANRIRGIQISGVGNMSSNE